MYRKADREQLARIEAKLFSFERMWREDMKGLTQALAKGQEAQAEHLRRIENSLRALINKEHK